MDVHSGAEEFPKGSPANFFNVFKFFTFFLNAPRYVFTVSIQVFNVASGDEGRTLRNIFHAVGRMKFSSMSLLIDKLIKLSLINIEFN